MQRIIKKIIVYFLVLSIVVFGVALGYIWLKNDNAEKLNSAYSELESYREIYEPLGDMLTGYAVVSDERYGKKISEDDLIPVDVPENCSENIILNVDDVIGKYYRVNVTAGTVITIDLVMDFPQTSDERAFDVITKFNPIGLETNDFVDIRFQMPSGEDYVALSHKRVEGVYSGVLKLVMSEYDILIYNSLIVDQILFKGSIIYATKYLEPGGQESAVENYPYSEQIISLLYNNPNTEKVISIETAHINRISLEKAYTEYAEDDLTKTMIESGKSEIPSRIQNGESEYRTQKEIEEQKRLEEAIISASGG